MCLSKSNSNGTQTELVKATLKVRKHAFNLLYKFFRIFIIPSVRCENFYSTGLKSNNNKIVLAQTDVLFVRLCCDNLLCNCKD